MDLSRGLDRAVRRLADDTNSAIASVPASPQFFTTVANASPLQVTWRGATVLAAGKDASYTPVVGDRVACSLIRDQLIVHHAINGQP